VRQLRMQEPLLIKGGFNRPNIHYKVGMGKVVAITLDIWQRPCWHLLTIIILQAQQLHRTPCVCWRTRRM
jgi:superfamily II DNA helicase RecQ